MALFNINNGFINQYGRKIILPPTYEAVWQFSCGLARVETPKGYGFINQEGELVIPVMDKKRYLVNEFVNGYVTVLDLQLQKYGLIDKNGQWIFEPQFEGLGHYCSGRLRVLDEKTNLKGYIDIHGSWIVPPKYVYASSYKGNVAEVATDKELFIIDLDGNVISRFPKEQSRRYNPWCERPSLDCNKDFLFIRDRQFHLPFDDPPEPLCTIQRLCKKAWSRAFGMGTLMKHDGTVIKRVPYCTVRPIHEGLCVVEYYGCGYVDATNHFKEVVPLRYSYAQPCSEGKLVVQKINRKGQRVWGCLNKQGEKILPFKYRAMSPFVDGIAAISGNDTPGSVFINEKGEEIYRDTNAWMYI